ncbi:hypothetical protein RB653_007925 [Dictyostelium firmibasis]|uniref:SET domain-containing protein n=1 Tax=Dictyostelium firmibasis TaxID=79012 RepID=A0AAN7YPG0_9MYCE
MKQRILLIVVVLLVAVIFVFGGEVKPIEPNEKETLNEHRRRSINRLNKWSRFYVKNPVFAVQKKVIKEGEEQEILKEDDKKEDEYGVFANAKIERGIELLEVKWTSCLSVDTIRVEQGELFERMVHYGLAQEDVLAVGLIMYKHCMAKETFNLKEWVASLPTRYDSSLYFSEQEMEYLAGSPAFVDIMVEKEVATKLYDQLSQSLFKDQVILEKCAGQPIDWDTFRWAHSTITARKIYVTDPDSAVSSDGKQLKLSPVVPPIIDYFNHATDPSAEIDYNEVLGSVDVKAIRDIKKGEEIFVSYDYHYCGSDLLVDYGYLPNKIDEKSCVNVLMEELLETISLDDPIKDDKYYLVNKLFETKDIKLKISMDSLTEDLLKISKYMAYKQESLLEYLKRLVSLKIGHYPTSIIQDKEFLVSQEYKQLSARSKLAFNLVLQEKQILSNVYTKLQENIEAIDSRDRKVKDEL